MNGLVQMLDMAGNTIQEQNRIIEAQGQEITRLTALVESTDGDFQFGENQFQTPPAGPSSGDSDAPLPTPPFSEGSKVQNC
ncbi:hypothetical protein KK103_12010 [Curtobacterium flaccumfaciens pv. flaccumfaciens]|uniref:Uncharacterized protein n=1 Tax=Curtobacterium flaccumfaciens pv. flaccumfaciens TaxID=138532 RepID=A0A9Q2W7P7_9MICO|nr:hypothetical protein [Curtobacterium flaccumfaciens]MBT1542490.1 hypothetical protein [Curtobacterium flaccumfaciens pv. flaccumfaciens]